MAFFNKYRNLTTVRSENWSSSSSQSNKIINDPTVNLFNESRVYVKSGYSFGNVTAVMHDILDESLEDDVGKNFLDYFFHLEQFLNDIQSQNKETIQLIMKVSLKASENQLMENNFRKYLQILATSDFLKKRIDFFISTEVYKSLDFDMLTLLLSFMKLLLSTIPGLVYDVLYPRIMNINLMVDNKKGTNESICESILKEIEELNILANSVSSFKKTGRFKNMRNDVEPPDDFRKYSAYPTKNDLLDVTTMEVFLRKNKTFGTYNSVDDYLDTQFRLLREDFIQPIREGINNYLNSIYRKYQPIKIYKNVEVVNSFPCNKNGIVYMLKFDNTRLKNINWEYSKRFLFGSFLCLSNDNFMSFIFATIIDRDVSDLSKGLLTVKFDKTKPNKHIKYILVESTTLFEPYKHVLVKLQETNDNNLPMKEYLVYVQKEISFPKYLIEKSELQCEMNGNSMIIGIENQIWPTADALSMDDSQFNAFKSALTNELVIIQGPPGTGKTFLGLAICKVLIESVQAKIENFGPILVVCYTNHALDQFLEGILEFSDKIVRVGSRSKSEKVIDYNLTALKNTEFTFDNQKSRCQGEMREVTNELISLQAISELSHHHIINFETIKQEISEVHRECFKEIGMKNWLIGHSILYNEFQAEFCTKTWFDLIRNKIRSTLKTFDYSWLEECEIEIINDENEEESFDERILCEDYFDIKEFNSKYKSTYHISKSTYFDIDNLQTANQLISKFLSSEEKMSEEEVDNLDSLKNLDWNNRWRLYRYWKTKYYGSLLEEIKLAEETFRNLNKELHEINLEEDRRIMVSKKIIGMTTTGAARYGKVLEQIQCKIIIFEEAAEVLESHIIGSLNPGCQHLIMIGDHKQLKPNPTVYELAKRYKLDLSLFERLINNELPYSTLALQHRMRPEIAEILKYIYPNLENDESVYKYPDIVGVRTNLYFFDHSESECFNEERMSFFNPYEALFVMKLCWYLIQNGIESSKITILTLYSEQLFEIKRLMSDRRFKEVRVCVVDNYQGEENDIILLSLVRSNEEEKIGFLNIENRICVSLSRAKHGLFVFGNFTILANQSQLWQNICNNLKMQKRLGDRFTLYCQNHPSKETVIKCPKDFDQCPEGCCNEICSKRLECGHSCKMYCHVLDKYHKKYKCKENCEKTCNEGHRCPLNCYETCGKCKENCKKTCNEGHRCPLNCYETCGKCNVIVTKIMPVCSHEKKMQCHLQPHHMDCDVICDRELPCGHIGQYRCPSKSVVCKVMIKRQCNKCKHEKEYPCHVTPKCLEDCIKQCAFGHLCILKCFQTCGRCVESVVKIIPKCQHEQKMQCSQNPDDFECKTMVVKTIPTCNHEQEMECGQSLDYVRCKKIVVKTIPKCKHEQEMECSQNPDYFNCKTMVVKTIPTCNHEQEMECSQSLDYVTCKTMVVKIIPKCKHEQEMECSQSPNYFNCKTMVVKTIPTCNHEQEMECSQSSNYFKCKTMVNIVLPCGHSNISKCKVGDDSISRHIFKSKYSLLKDPEPIHCKTIVDYILPCGHTIQRLCKEIKENLDQSIKVNCVQPCIKYCENGHLCELKCFQPCKCLIPVSKVIPICNHSQNIPCYKDAESSDCEIKNELILKCGHVIVRECKETKILNEIKSGLYNCLELCKKICENGHPCSLKCHEACRCQILISKIIPNCNHSQVLPCYKSPESVDCKTKYELPCGHTKLILCNEIFLYDELLRSDQCEKSSPSSSISISNSNLTILRCEFQCDRVLLCGHKCSRLCYENCEPCTKRIQRCRDCGMEYDRKCTEKLICDKKCTTVLSCKHICPGTCNSCNGGRLHQSCSEASDIKLVCGHSQNVNCSNEVKSCWENCTEACFHLKCKNLCFEDCINCNNLCSWKCPHFKCTKQCFEFCDRPFCDSKCSEIIICHDCHRRFACYGVCGEICRNICPRCDPYLKNIKIEKLKNRKFLTLRTCGHTFDCDVLDKYMATTSNNGVIAVKKCPKCATGINNSSCFRYSNIVKIISLDIKRVKKFISNRQQIVMLDEFVKKLDKCPDVFDIFSYLEIENYFSNIVNMSNILQRTESGTRVSLKNIEISNFEMDKWRISHRLANEIYENFYSFLTCEPPDLDIYQTIKDSLSKLLIWLNPDHRVFDDFDMNRYICEFNRLYLLRKIAVEKFCFPVDLIEKLKECKSFNLKIAEKFHKHILQILGEQDGFERLNYLSFDNIVINDLHKGIWCKCKKGHYFVQFKYLENNKCRKCSLWK